MVTLPELDSYSEIERKKFFSQSQVLEHYFKFLQRSPANLPEEIRHLKHQHWLKCAFATLGRRSDAETICRYWSEQSEIILKKAWSSLNLSQDELSLFGFGKLGSQELNLSSDIDIVILKRNENEDAQHNTEVKKFIKLLSETTSLGFAYRVDLSLRPGGEHSPLIPSKARFFNYYDEFTEAWNRISFIRLRPLIGNPAFNSEILQYCHRWSYPRRLDFSVINEIKHIRSKLEYQWRKASEPLDIKFHPGGIRDIELYIQSLQVIYGGRHPDLKESSITVAMKKLHDLKVLDRSDYQFFREFYWQLRDIENHIHIYADKHTYVLRPEVLQIIQPLYKEADIIARLQQSHKIVSHFFVTDASAEQTQLPALDKLSADSRKSIDDIVNLKSHSLKREEIEKLKSSILNSFLNEVDKIAVDPDLAIQIFRDFIYSIKSKSSIFYLLNRHRELLNNLAWLFSISPFIGQILCRRPELMDSFALGKVSIHKDEEIDSFLENLVDYKLLGQLISIIYLCKEKDISNFVEQISRQADFIVTHLLDYLQDHFQAEKVEVLCLGKWSGHELGTQSDLDFIFLTEKSPTAAQAKLARRFINHITSSTKAGRLYNVDMRLKPNESSGPLLVEKSKLLEFIKVNADPWQKLAYLRSRKLGTDGLYFERNLDLLWIDNQEWQEITEIHKKLLVTRTGDAIDIKLNYGGIAQTEFAIQKYCLLHKCTPKTSATADIFSSLHLPDKHQNKIIENYFFLRKFEQIFQVCNDSPSTKVSPTNPNMQRLGKLLNIEQPFAQLAALIEEQTELLKSLDLTY